LAVPSSLRLRLSILNTLTRDPPSDYQTQVHNASEFGQLQLDLVNQVFLTGALRDDCSTTFGRANRCAVFPKMSAAWTFTNAYKPPGITFGKLRFSHGEAGNEPQPYLSSVTFSGTNLVGGIAQGTGFTPTQSGRGGLFFTSTKPATALRPERTKESEGGFDIGFLGRQGRLERNVVCIKNIRCHPDYPRSHLRRDTQARRRMLAGLATGARS